MGLEVIKSRYNHSWDVPKTRLWASGSLSEPLRPSRGGAKRREAARSDAKRSGAKRSGVERSGAMRREAERRCSL